MIKIEHTELLNIYEEINRYSFNTPIKGLVQIFQDGQLIHNKNTKEGWITNLQIASGREFVSQRMFGVRNGASSLPDMTEHVVNCFGIGQGGTTIDGQQNIIFAGPKLCDTGLYNPIPINNNAFAVNSVDNIAKEITSDGVGIDPGIISTQINNKSEFTDCEQYYTITACECILTIGEPVDITGVNKIDEAVLFATVPNTTNNNRHPIPYAHITFQPRPPDQSSKLTIMWYIIT